MTDTPDTIRSGSGGDEPESYCPACGQSFAPEVELCPNDRARLVRLVDKADPLIGRVFEQRYEIRSRLGEGGMGTVYRGWQLSVDREVAIKVIDPKLSSNRGVVKRFLREARLSSRLSQPSIVNVYDFGQTEDGILYIVMELLRGHTLARELAARRAFGLERTIGIAIQLCDALDAAHNQGIIHRDLKPGNVVILDDPPGRDLVKVLDFGLAKSLISDAMSKVTHTDAMLGTPLYMSPEQIEGHQSDQRADLYALGCMLHEMVSGAPPFSAATVNGVLSKHLYEMAAPLPVELPPSLADLILRLIARHPDERPQTAAEVRTALLRELGQTSVLGARVMAERPSTARRPAARGFAVANPTTSPSIGTSAVARSGRRWLIGLAALVALGALVAAIAVGLSRNRAPAAAPAPIAAPSIDAAAPAVDAGVAVAPVDARAGRAVGGTRAAEIDAAVRPRTNPPVVRVDAGRVARPGKPPIDAATELDFYKPDATP